MKLVERTHPIKVQVRHPISGERMLGMASHRTEAGGADDGARVWDVRLDNGGRLTLSEFEARAFQLIVLEGLKKSSRAARAQAEGTGRGR